MRLAGFGVCVLVGIAGVILPWAGWVVAEAWRDRHPKQPAPLCSFPTSQDQQDFEIDCLRTMYLEGQIESDEFEARLWRAVTRASSPEQIAAAEAIAESLPGERDEVFRLMRQARDWELENSATPNRVIVENNRVKVLRGDK